MYLPVLVSVFEVLGFFGFFLVFFAEIDLDLNILSDSKRMKPLKPCISLKLLSHDCLKMKSRKKHFVIEQLLILFLHICNIGLSQLNSAEMISS